jgi:hypothetical protein
MGARAVTTGAETRAASDVRARSTSDVPESERVRIHDVDPSVRPPAAESQREVRARDVNDPSPHLDGRAQPGDVIGVETGGERTYVGDTAEDENKRRRDAEEANEKIRRDKK